MIKTTLTLDDYLQYQLYTASKSKAVRNQRIRSWIITTALFVLMGYFFRNKEDAFMSNYFYIMSAVCGLLFPFYSRWRFRKHYMRHVKELAKNKVGVQCQVSIDKPYISTQDQTGEARIKLSEVEQINEIKDELFVQLRTGQSIILPTRTEGYPAFAEELRLHTQSQNIHWNKEPNWKWR